MTEDDSQYLASNFLKKKDNDSQYLASNFIKKPKEEKRSLLQRAAEDIEEHINKPIESLGRSARNIVGGFGQGIVNIVPALYNLGATGANALGANIPKSPLIDIVPHGPSETAGEIASFFAPGALFKLLGKAPAFMHTAKSTMKIPMIAEGIKHASNILNKAPLASKVAGNAILGGAYAPENPLLGIGLGAAAPIAGKGISSSVEALEPFIKNPKNLFTTKNSLKNIMLKEHDVLENRASKAFNHVSNEINKRGINTIPNEKYLSPEFFSDLKNYFPKTKASANLIEKAKTGDYNSLRKIQSDLYKRAKKNLGSDFEADALRGEEMLEKRNFINEAISKHLKNTGHNDLDKVLNEARHDWSNLQKTYYNDNISNALIKMFNKDIRKIPKNLINLLSEESIPMKNLLNSHPGLEEKLLGHKTGKNTLKAVSKYGIPTAGAATILDYWNHR